MDTIIPMPDTILTPLPEVITDELKKAFSLLQDGKADEAIAVCSTPQMMPYIQSHSSPCYILGKAYFRRGDSKGDVFAGTWFLEKALALGEDCSEVYAMLAVFYFRQRKFQNCSEACSHFMNDQVTAPDSWLVFGIASLLSGACEECVAANQKASSLDPDRWEPYAVMACACLCLEQPDKADAACAQLDQFADKSVASRIRDELQADSLSSADLYILLLNTSTLAFSGYSIVPPQEPEIEMPQALSAEIGTSDTPKDFNWIVKNIPCQAACPALTNVPEYINDISNDAFQKAYLTNLHCNVFPGILGRVCSRPCEAACRHGFDGNGDPVAICYLKRVTDDFKTDTNAITQQPLFPPSGKTVAIIGSGPAGLTAARDLALYGHSVTVFESYHEPGGMLNQGIPKFRLPRDVIEQEISLIRDLGIDIKCNTKLGKDITLDALLKEYDAVILALGTLRPNIPELPGSDLNGIMHGLQFMEEVNRTDHGTIGKQVIIIGGGFTAMDCSRSAFRLGAEHVSIYYRRTENEMPVTHEEIVEARNEGIDLVELMSPVEYLGENGHVTAIMFIKNVLGEPDASGRRRPVPVEGTETILPADTVLLATGQFPEYSALTACFGDSLFDGNWLSIDPDTHMTPVDALFATGDFSSGASTIIEAVGIARKTALKVDTWLMGAQRRKSVVRVESAGLTGRIREYDELPLQPMPMIDMAERVDLAAEVENGFQQDSSLQESRRCYLCHYKFEIDMRTCIYCDWCIKAKPAHLDCIKKVAEFDRDEHGIICSVREAEHSDETRAIWIDSHECIRCGQCLRACPVDAISLQKVFLDEESCEQDDCGNPFLELQE